jgi:hypothetical protein
MLWSQKMMAFLIQAGDCETTGSPLTIHRTSPLKRRASVGQSGELAQRNMGSKNIMRTNISITVKLIRL